MFHMLKRVVGTPTGPTTCGIVIEQLYTDEVDLFRDIIGVSLTVTEYWLKATERIMNDLYCTPVQKLKGAISLLRDETYLWWLTV